MARESVEERGGARREGERVDAPEVISRRTSLVAAVAMVRVKSLVERESMHKR